MYLNVANEASIFIHHQEIELSKQKVRQTQGNVDFQEAGNRHIMELWCNTVLLPLPSFVIDGRHWQKANAAA